jgi:uncharacterized protein (TIGR04255 family)
MRFPPSERVRYKKNPLVEVICQLRFPKILRIEKEPPVDFQEAIRDSYPRLEASQAFDLAVPVGGQTNAPPFSLNRGQSYEFLSKEADWKLVLAGDFLALSTSKYRQWEEFRDRLQSAIDLLVTLYKPSHFSRTGLRYQGLIARSDLGLQSSPWSLLLKPSIAGMLAAEGLPRDGLLEVLSLFSYRLDHNNAVARVRHGLARKSDTSELCYLIDADIFSEAPIEVGDAIRTLNIFNEEAGNLFRWCITDELRDAMEPEPVNK